MTSGPPQNESPARAYARLLLRLHSIIAEGRGDSDEAASISDEMDAPWYAMTRQEQERMRGLSRDLYALAEGGPKPVDMSPAERQDYSARATAAFAALTEGDNDSALKFLRESIPRNLPRSVIPFLQARCWERLGDLEVALVFMKEAERLDSTHAVSVLTLLQRLQRANEALDVANQISDNTRSSPEDLYLAACALFLPTRPMTAREATPLRERSAAALRRALDLARTQPREIREIPDIESFITSALGVCYEGLGRLNEALALYDEALALRPNDGELLTLRGLARYYQGALGPALNDFQMAVQAGAPSVWPYFFLAEHSLEQGDYLGTWRLCLQALQRPEVPITALAQLHEYLGISQAMLGQPVEVIRENFDKAQELDPSSERIRHNRAVAEARVNRTNWARNGWRIRVDENLAQSRTDRLTLKTLPQDLLKRRDSHNLTVLASA